MTEADELTIQRYQAIVRGWEKNILRFEAMFAQLLDTVHNRHFRAMDALIEGKRVTPLNQQEALAAFAEQLGHIAKGTPREELDLLPRFLRLTERVRF
jgi:hypothetical protein